MGYSPDIVKKVGSISFESGKKNKDRKKIPALDEVPMFCGSGDQHFVAE
jgi:hypothetical protein